MKHAEFRKRIEALYLEANKLRDDVIAGNLPPSAQFLVELGQFEVVRLVLEVVTCHSPEPVADEPRIIVPE